MYQFLKSMLALLILPIIAGCASGPILKDVTTPDADSKIVFGSVNVIVGDEPQEWGYQWEGINYFYLFILPSQSNVAMSYKVANSGQFYWALPADEYILLGYLWQQGNRQLSGDVRARFTVPETGGDRYIGAIEFRGAGPSLQPYFNDSYDRAKVAYDAKFPARKGTSVKQLLEMPQPMGKFSDILPICDISFQVECSERFRGVTPTQPVVTDTGFPQVQTLRPEFRWQGSSRADADYDFILYEAATYTVEGAVKDYSTKGRLIRYVENLPEPGWQAEKPLKPGTRYYWSVRVRAGDRVSSWSTHGYSFNVLLAWGHGAGQWFQFQTP